MSLRPRAEVKNLKTCYHGGSNLAELRDLGLTLEDVLDFSVSSNPFPPPPGVKKALNTAVINRYPDPEATELKERLSERIGVAPHNILAGNGSTELIRLIALAYFKQGDPVIIIEPTFGEYELACQIAGARVVKQWAKAEDDFVPRLDETISLIKKHHPRGIFICNPSSPAGNYLSRQEVEAILDNAENSLLIMDEAFIAFVEEGWSSVDLIRGGNLIIIRSMTKDYSLAGLRLGYAIAHTGIIDNLHRVCPPWNVNAMAQKAGIVALDASEYLEQCKQKMARAKQFLIDELSQINFTVVPSKANFFMVKVGDAKQFRSGLLKQGIVVRDCTSFGLPEYIRVASRTMSECRKFIASVKTLKREGKLG